MLARWNNGLLEYWNVGMLGHLESGINNSELETWNYKLGTCNL